MTCRAWALLLGALLVWAAPVSAQQDATWSTNPISGDYGDTANWSPAGPPGGTAFFGTSTITSLSSINPVPVNGWTFNAGASNYSFTINADFMFFGAGIVVNGGSVAITNLGGLWFYNTSTAGNATIINQDFLQFFNTSTAGSSTITNNFGRLYFFDSSTAGNATITNNGTVRFSGTATAGSSTITNNTFLSFLNNSTAGNAAITNGDFGTVDFSASTGPNNDGKLSAGSIAGVGKLYLGADQLTVGGNNLSTVVDGIISDCGNGADCLNSGATGGSLVKTGTGTLTLAATNSYTGATIVNAGTLNVTGDITSSSGVTVNSGGTLAGTGTVGSTQINSGGALAPGALGSVLTVAGSLAFQSGAVYMVQINAAGAASGANVSATATLTGASVNVTAAAGVYTIGQSYTILAAAGGLGGTTFSGLNISGSVRGHLSYDVHDVFFIVDPSTLTLPAGLSGNQLAAAGAINRFISGGGTLPPGFLSVLNLTGPALANALAQFTGEIGAGSQRTSFIAMTQLIGVLLDPFNRSDDGSTAGGGVTGYANEGDASAYAADGRKRSGSERNAYAMMTKAPPQSFEARWSVWGAGYGGSQTTDGNVAQGTNTATSRIYGTAVGADYLISPNTMVGFALAGGGTNYSIANGLGTGRSDMFQAAGFFREKIGAAYLAGALAYGWQDTTTNRTVTVAGIDQLQAKFRSDAFSGRLEGGYRFVGPMAFGITPYAAGQFTTFNLPAYAEQALVGTNTFALAYGAKSITSPRSELGVRTDKSWALTDSILTLRGRLAWAHDYNPNASVAATFQTLPGASFVTNGAAAAPDAALTTASAELKWRNGFSLAGTFEGEFSNVTRSYAGKGIARYQW